MKGTHPRATPLSPGGSTQTLTMASPEGRRGQGASLSARLSPCRGQAGVIMPFL